MLLGMASGMSSHCGSGAGQGQGRRAANRLSVAQLQYSAHRAAISAASPLPRPYPGTPAPAPAAPAPAPAPGPTHPIQSTPFRSPPAPPCRRSIHHTSGRWPGWSRRGNSSGSHARTRPRGRSRCPAGLAAQGQVDTVQCSTVQPLRQKEKSTAQRSTHFCLRVAWVHDLDVQVMPIKEVGQPITAQHLQAGRGKAGRPGRASGWTGRLSG